ncbi:nucleotidyltransferase [Paenibacillus sp. GCM10027627]|uniref:nucleotidyltransferase n=1 Tax=unclassified Paenibacillus TaxID=185978 RepID=UPI00363570A1
MRAVGLIVEYNPFHNGHRYHLRQSQRISGAEAVVAVMSGNFLQRGEPAMWDKWTRTQMALQGGCDLVIELPVAYATQAAEWFAYGAVSLLEATGVVDSFCFGTESGLLEPLELAAEMMASEPPKFQSLLKARLETGINYPAAYSSAVQDYLTEAGFAEAASFAFDMPNHTLGLHYLIALRRIGGAMKPFTIAREKAQYHQHTITDGAIASATAIRKLLLEGSSVHDTAAYIPSSTYSVLRELSQKGVRPVSWDNYFPALLHLLMTSDSGKMAKLHEITEGLEHRVLNALPVLPDPTYESLLSLLKTKRYTRTKLQRALLSILLGHVKEDFTPAMLSEGVQYIRILGFTEKGGMLLKQMRKSASLPVLMSAARPPERYRYLELDIRASNAYRLGMSPSGTCNDLFRDYRDKPIML